MENDMKSSRLLPCVLAAMLCAAAAVGVATAQQYQPQVGQEGKDVVWVPTAQALVDKMLEMAKATPKDYVIDLGSGDGRTVITAAKRGIKAHGIEYNPNMVELAKANAAKEGVGDKATFVQADIFESNFSQATVLTLFLLTDLNIRLRPTILDMKPGTRVVSNSFGMGDWTPDETVQLTQNCSSFCRAHLWIVPAKVEGTWKSPAGDLVLEQKYQKLSGRLSAGNVVAPIADGKMSGEEISFTAGGTAYSGRVAGDAIEGTSTAAGGSATPWRATRAAR
jgi:SAM-dependent methyltransferase